MNMVKSPPSLLGTIRAGGEVNGHSSFLESLKAEDRAFLSETPCFESTVSFDQACERARYGFIPRSFIFVGCKDIVDMAMAKAVYYLDRADGVLDRGDLYNQAYLMVLEQLERWNPWTTTFRKYLYATLPLRLRKYIDSIKYHGKEHRKQETAVKPSEFSGEMEDGEDAGGSPQTISVEERERFSDFDSLPFDVRLVIQCNEADEGRARIKNSSYIRVKYAAS